ncbi:MAG TPA: CdaR family protein [Thermoanaerobaculia bacterium]|jgi:YbbR domain-containing protein|nr:CdaR family protein [Thermoanaerobaculia bacterium]
MSDRRRIWGLRVLALAIAIGIWSRVSLEEREETTEKLVEAGVSYNLPRGYLVLNQVQNVLVRLRGSRKAIRGLNPYMVDVQIQLAPTSPETVTVQLGADNLLMPEDLEFVAIEPNAIQVELDREVTQRVLVEPRLKGKPAAGSKAGQAEVFPNQVLVSGPEKRLSRLASLPAQQISLEGHGVTFEEEVDVISPDPLIQVVQPSKVTVKVPILTPEVKPDSPHKAKRKKR